MSEPDVIVIGAGVAGLAVARDVSAAGLRVLLLEARARMGGRVLTYHTPDGPIELGAEFVHGAYAAVLRVAERAGLALREWDRSAPPQPVPG
ncbi:MAG: FAD-dependent oxidoreductase, partial [Polyangiaceae bacterium]